ncbi:MAG: hypothetical protein ACXABY_26005, partial [Candidatus Thorarchaeota archaeon]
MTTMLLMTALLTSGQVRVYVPGGADVQVMPGSEVRVVAPWVNLRVPILSRRVLPHLRVSPLWYNNGVPHFRSRAHADRYFRWLERSNFYRNQSRYPQSPGQYPHAY